VSLNLPDSAVEVDQRARTDVQRQLPQSNPFLKNSWLGALITGYANRVFDFYLQLKEAIKQSFPDTATGDSLEEWAAIWGRNRLAATVADGNVVATGVAASVIPTGTVYTDSDGNLYDSVSDATIALSSMTIVSITRVGATATATTLNNHNLASNVPVTITGAVETEYNIIDGDIQVTGLKTFTYQVTGTPATPATGTITGSHTSAVVPVQSEGFGEIQNQILDAVLSLQSPIVGVDDDANVDFNEISGGTDQETDTELQSRLVERIQNPVAHFSESEIVSKAKEINGVTRVFVQPITPEVGAVTIYFLRDQDADPIPTGSQITEVKNKILEITPANTDPDDVIVAAPSPVNVDFTFASISPNTVSMKTAVTASLQQFFDENTSVGVNIDKDSYRAAIFNTVDVSTGQVMESFELTFPTGDIAITSNQIGVLNNVTYP